MRTMNALEKTTVEPGHLGGVHTTLEKFLKKHSFHSTARPAVHTLRKRSNLKTPAQFVFTQVDDKNILKTDLFENDDVTTEFCSKTNLK